jgi:hypothetical protein
MVGGDAIDAAIAAEAHGIPQLVHQARLELQRRAGTSAVGGFQQRDELGVGIRQAGAVPDHVIEQAEQFPADMPQIGVGKPLPLAQGLI